MNTDRIQHIDTWRAIAILLVLSCHIVVYSHPWYRATFPALSWRLSALGLLGVQLFFCISGYVICRGLMSERATSGTVSLRAFYIRRAYRIFGPLFTMIVVTGLLAGAGLLTVTTGQLIQASAFLCNLPTPGVCGWHLGHTWSLAYEEQFYLVFPLMFVCAGLYEKRHRFATITVLILAGIVVTNAISLPLVANYLGHFLCMIVGCLCALYREKLASTAARIPPAAWAASLLALVGMKCVVLPPVLAHYVEPAITPVLLAMVIFATPMRVTAVRRLFTNRGLIHIGRISYGIYLWQQLATADYGFDSPVPALALVFGACAFAHFSFKYVEQDLIIAGGLASDRAKASNMAKRDAAAPPAPPMADQNEVSPDVRVEA